MRIAQVAPVIESVPPKKYGGTERVVSALTEELVRMGHDVTLFASGDSVTRARLVSVYPRAIRDARLKDIYGPNYWTMLNIGTAYERQESFDIIHDHNGYLSLPTANISNTPVLLTLHGSFDPVNKQFYSKLDKKVKFVSISKRQAAWAPNLNWAGTVYNGLKFDKFPFEKNPGEYLLYVGRMSYEKGAHIAIEVAQYLNLPLVIAAKLDSVDLNYYQDYVGPHLGSQIKWVGEVDEEERNKLMSRALCLLHPITWEEPFGLTMIETMACGTPVIAFNKGSIPEVVNNCKSGFIVEDVEEMINAVLNIKQISRKYCRDYALKNFNAQKMTEGYLKIYNKILEEN
ncbi:hypothetical protein A2872_01715 [Candidatus Gottesmanbacteria bacterium RIFCSPHIGHO2_01_FULL_42_12]|uniref:Glycosyl transferase n=1 Tax=Candidatus Gottesmanbacteria bacterium RIFCSPHIGHO2_01_FULL_42_12 TaxID=1798377 RepID=A0A1F5Z669_9BACT|nr:MAG: hypothetical protein A2872_01715 [Candidatus Gottesmanbacteria bacterium RIFCSPHIGHO2_01_FULL_42_12]